MIAPSRIRPFLQIVGLIALIIASINVAFYTADRLRPDLFPRSMVGGGFIMQGLSRIEAIERRREKAGNETHKPVCAIIGQSTVGSAVSLKMMRELTGNQWEFLRLRGGGKRMVDLIRLIEPLSRSRLKPELAIIGVHSFFLLDPDTQFFFAIPGEKKAEEPRRPTDLLRPFMWIADRRTDAVIEFQLQLTILRAALTPRLGIPIRTYDQGPAEPDLIPTARSVTEEEVAKMEVSAGPRWELWFSQLDQTGGVARTLVEAIRGLRERGTRVVVVVMPEITILRKRSRPAANPALLNPIREAFDPPGVEILDFQDLLPDSAFGDSTHPNQQGEKIFTPALVKAIPELARAAEVAP